MNDNTENSICDMGKHKENGICDKSEAHKNDVLDAYQRILNEINYNSQMSLTKSLEEATPYIEKLETMARNLEKLSAVISQKILWYEQREAGIYSSCMTELSESIPVTNVVMHKDDIFDTYQRILNAVNYNSRMSSAKSPEEAAPYNEKLEAMTHNLKVLSSAISWKILQDKKQKAWTNGDECATDALQNIATITIELAEDDEEIRKHGQKHPRRGNMDNGETRRLDKKQVPRKGDIFVSVHQSQNGVLYFSAGFRKALQGRPVEAFCDDNGSQLFVRPGGLNPSELYGTGGLYRPDIASILGNFAGDLPIYIQMAWNEETGLWEGNVPI